MDKIKVLHKVKNKIVEIDSMFFNSSIHSTEFLLASEEEIIQNEGGQDLSKMPFQELRKLAKAKGIEVTLKTKKEEILEKLTGVDNSITS